MEVPLWNTVFIYWLDICTKSTKTGSGKRKGRKNKDSDRGTNVNEGWLMSPWHSPVLSQAPVCFPAALFSHVRSILWGASPKWNPDHLWELKPAGVPMKPPYRKALAGIPKVSSLLLASTWAKACQQQQRKFRTKRPAVILERLW